MSYSNPVQAEEGIHIISEQTRIALKEAQDDASLYSKEGDLAAIALKGISLGLKPVEEPREVTSRPLEMISSD
jgi:hypothetical protein